MIDDDDVTYALYDLGHVPPGSGCFWIALAILLVVFIAWAVNEDECSQKTCTMGFAAKLIDGECLCVENAQ